MSFLEKLDWRYATKKFDSSRTISPENLAKILEAIRKTPTGYGVMPFRVLVISNDELRAKLKAASWNQNQIDTSSELLVFVANTDLQKMADEFFVELSGGDATKREALAGYEGSARDFLANIPASEHLRLASEQAYIGLGFGLAAAAELEIDSCPMSGFDPKAYQEILGLPENEVPVALLPIGYRAETETPYPKFRLSNETLFKFIK